MIVNTGWTWQYIDTQVTLQIVTALNAFWDHTPPPCIQLKRIASALGIEQKTAPTPIKKQDEPQDLSELLGAGLGITQGRPNDPMLDFLDVEFKINR